MTCRIDRVVARGDFVVLRISGRITGPNVDTLRAALEQEAKMVTIDLKDVLLVDSEAVKLLALAGANGADLQNCPAYVREWIVRERALMDRAGGQRKRQKKGKNDDGV